jgi:hypothetical protein
MDIVTLASNDSGSGGYLTLVVPLGFLILVLLWGWAMRHRVP